MKTTTSISPPVPSRTKRVPPGRREQPLSIYQRIIVEATGCTEGEARGAEEIMRHDIFHSTLDWQSRPLLEKAARLAVASLRKMPVSTPRREEIECAHCGSSITVVVLEPCLCPRGEEQ
jgi:hypothetical protein